LPNKVIIPDIKVLSGDFQGYDIIIGMDIITLGDFALTNFEGKTKCSFRMPSMMEIDFVKKSHIETYISDDGKQGRNSKCHCGSGKKYKNCCGK
jgi:uncharacterized protein YchJ